MMARDPKKKNIPKDLINRALAENCGGATGMHTAYSQHFTLKAIHASFDLTVAAPPCFSLCDF
jgi:hypothetical protein